MLIVRELGCSYRERYLYKYPGDQYVDILGLDVYTSDWSKELDSLRTVVSLSKEKGKISALTETGEENVPQSNYWTERLLKPIENDPIAKDISYMMIWRNGSKKHFYGPYPGHHSSSDFVNFSNDAFLFFAK